MLIASLSVPVEVDKDPDISLDELPEVARLALASATSGDRDLWLAFFALDARLGQIVLRAQEPMLAQLRLAWWRDELAKPVGGRNRGDWLIASIARGWGDKEQALTLLVNAWERLLDDAPLRAETIRNFAAERGAACRALARHLSDDDEGAAAVGNVWSLAMIASSAQTEADRIAALELAQLHELTVSMRPRRLRPFAVIGGLSVRALSRGGSALLGDRLSPLVALRIGLLGR